MILWMDVRTVVGVPGKCVDLVIGVMDESLAPLPPAANDDDPGLGPQAA
jgi:hypothetical protein